MPCLICQREECQHDQADINRADIALISKQLGQPFNKVFEAARILYDEGVGGIDLASQLVGNETAMAMLTMQLIHDDNRELGPMRAGTKHVIVDVLADGAKRLK